jgi:thiamine-monophosphate kinase
MIEDKNPQRTSIAQLGEFALIDHLTKKLWNHQPSDFKKELVMMLQSWFKDKKSRYFNRHIEEGVHFDLAHAFETFRI